MNFNTPDPSRPLGPRIVRRRFAGVALTGVGVAAFLVLLSWSVVQAFERQAPGVSLSAVDSPESIRPAIPWRESGAMKPASPVVVEVPTESDHNETQAEPSPSEQSQGTNVAELVSQEARASTVDRSPQVIMLHGEVWTGPTFDGRPIRPVQTRNMRTTAYSPDERSCGKWADGITASGMSVWTNGMKLVAADRSIPFGTILTIPGYNGERPVQVLDRGGAIRGNRLDLLYPRHNTALQWGVQDLEVTFWEYADE